MIKRKQEIEKSKKEDREKVAKNDIPDYVSAASLELQKVYFEFLKKKREIEDHSRRFFCFENDFGEQCDVDLYRTINIVGAVKKLGGSTEVAERAIKEKKTYINPLMTSMRKAKSNYAKAFGIRQRTSTKTVELTPQLMNWFGSHYTIEDIKRVAKEKHSVDFSYDELKRFHHTHKEVIDQRKQEYLLRNRDFRIATETGRLEILNRLLIEMEMKFNKTSDVEYSREIIKILEQARKEIKGQEVKLTIDGHIDINASIQGMNNVLSTMKELSINAMVVGLTAAKVGLSPETIIAQLATSWYKNVNGFSGNIIGSEEVMLPSVLISQYDWGTLQQKSKEYVDDFRPISDVVELPVDEIEEVELKRKRLLDALSRARKASSKS